MRHTHKQVGLAGFVPDLAPDTLPGDAISGGENMASTVKGWEKVRSYLQTDVTAHNERTHLFFWSPSDGDFRWLIAGATSILEIQSSQVTDVTRKDRPYNAGGLFTWNSLNFNGIIVFNNGADTPQYLASSGKFEDFPELGIGVRFKVVSKFRSYLMGLGVDIGSGIEASSVYWSHPADPGTMPISWDYADPAIDAGITVLPSKGIILDALELGNVNFIYKSDATFVQRFIGGNLIFSFELKFANQGILATGCVAAFGQQHFVVTGDDIIVHDGVSSRSVADERVRRWFFKDLNETYDKRTFCVANPDKKEIMVFYPSDASLDGVCDKCLVWNWVTGNFHIRRLENVNHATFGRSTAGFDAPVWDNEVNNWNTDLTATWRGDFEIPDFNNEIHVSVKEDEKLLAPNYRSDLPSKVFAATWERKDIALGAQSRDGVVTQDYDVRKTIRAIHFNVGTDTKFQVTLGTREDLDDPIVWSAPEEVDPLITTRIDTFITTGFLSVQIESEAENFVIRAIGFDYDLSGDVW